jgi:hypothetical protein
MIITTWHNISYMHFQVTSIAQLIDEYAFNANLNQYWVESSPWIHMNSSQFGILLQKLLFT